MQEYILNVFDLVNLSFRTEADEARVKAAHEYAQGLYEELKIHGGSLNRDRLLAILLLGITDALLQQRKANESYDDSLLSLLKKIDDMLPNTTLSSMQTKEEEK